MRAIEYTKKTSSNMIRLFYATCTNDLIIYSKQASNIEFFVLAFFIELNRLFISDSFFMNKIQRHVIQKIKLNLDTKKSVQEWFSMQDRNTFLEFYNSTILFAKLNKEKRLELGNHLSHSVSKFFLN